jgi:hypothetical protein
MRLLAVLQPGNAVKIDNSIAAIRNTTEINENLLKSLNFR